MVVCCRRDRRRWSPPSGVRLPHSRDVIDELAELCGIVEKASCRYSAVEARRWLLKPEGCKLRIWNLDRADA